MENNYGQNFDNGEFYSYEQTMYNDAYQPEYSDFPAAEDSSAALPENDPAVKKYQERLLKHLNEQVSHKKDFPAWAVLMMLVLCLPLGIGVLIGCTRWGAFAKTFITIFMLGIWLAIYEILAAKSAELPSLIGLIGNFFSSLF